MSNEGLKNKMAKKLIKKKTGYTIFEHCKRNNIDINGLTEENKAELRQKLDDEYETLYQRILTESGATIGTIADENDYDFKTNTFMEEN